MFSIQGNVHDRYTLEFKIGFSKDNDEQKEGDFKMDSWIFVPDTLGINASTYSKEAFYRDYRFMVRLITPVFTLADIANPKALPLSRLEKWCEIIGTPTTEDKLKRHEYMYEHQVKMFCVIVRAAMRNESNEICNNKNSAEDTKQAFGNFATQMQMIVQSYRDMKQNTRLHEATNEMKSIFDLGDEYLSRVTIHTMLRMMDSVKKQMPNIPADTFKCFNTYIEENFKYARNRGFVNPSETSTRQNRNFLYRASQLKKYIESDLWIVAKAHSNTFLLQQFVLMLAAGLSMVWATVISFSFQQTYGNFTMPLFIALVISYMLKDRIKQLLQIWFATKLGSYMYEYKTKLAFSDEEIGFFKTGMDFVHFHKLPLEILHQRGKLSTLEAGNDAIKEKVIIFRQRIRLFTSRLAKLSHYPLQGINEIVRINLREFLRRMDASHAPVYIWDGDGSYHTTQAEKVYYVHFIIRIRYQGKTEYHRYRVCLHRRGIVQIEEF